MPTTPKGNLPTPVPKWGNIRALERGNVGSSFSRTPLLGATRSGATITETGDLNEPIVDLANQTAWLRQRYVLRAELNPLGIGNQIYLPILLPNTYNLLTHRVVAWGTAISGTLSAVGLRFRTNGGYIGSQFNMTVVSNEATYQETTDRFLAVNNSGSDVVTPYGLEVTALTQTGSSRLFVYVDFSVVAP
jgi:hypothetical protein